MSFSNIENGRELALPTRLGMLDAIFEPLGIAVLEHYPNDAVWLDLGCGSVDPAIKSITMVCPNTEIRKIGNVLGRDKTIGIDVGSSMGQDSSYMHVKHRLHPNDDTDTLIDAVNSQIDNPRFGRETCWAISAQNLVHWASPSPYLERTGISSVDLKKQIQVWAQELLVPNGLLIIDDEYWIKCIDENNFPVLEFLGRNFVEARETIATLLQ